MLKSIFQIINEVGVVLSYNYKWSLCVVGKNWCFWTAVLEKTLESPLDCKEIQPVHSEGDQSWVLIRRTDAEAETPLLWPPHAELIHWKRLWCWEGLGAVYPHSPGSLEVTQPPDWRNSPETVTKILELSPSSICSQHNRSVIGRWDVEAKDSEFIQETRHLRKRWASAL